MQGLEGDIENRDLLISNGILVAVPHEAARMNKVGEGHTALRWRALPAAAGTRPTLRARAAANVCLRAITMHNMTSTMRIMASSDPSSACDD